MKPRQNYEKLVYKHRLLKEKVVNWIFFRPTVLIFVYHTHGREYGKLLT